MWVSRCILNVYRFLKDLPHCEDDRKTDNIRKKQNGAIQYMNNMKVQINPDPRGVTAGGLTLSHMCGFSVLWVFMCWVSLFCMG